MGLVCAGVADAGEGGGVAYLLPIMSRAASKKTYPPKQVIPKRLKVTAFWPAFAALLAKDILSHN